MSHPRGSDERERGINFFLEMGCCFSSSFVIACHNLSFAKVDKWVPEDQLQNLKLSHMTFLILTTVFVEPGLIVTKIDLRLVSRVEVPESSWGVGLSQLQEVKDFHFLLFQKRTGNRVD